jgi:hypothetical protein
MALSIFLLTVLLSNAQQFSTLNAQFFCRKEEGRKPGRGRTVNVFFRVSRNYPVSHIIPQRYKMLFPYD